MGMGGWVCTSKGVIKLLQNKEHRKSNNEKKKVAAYMAAQKTHSKHGVPNGSAESDLAMI
eukprot:16810-Pelagomonas_calceolata.AAC.2